MKGKNNYEGIDDNLIKEALRSGLYKKNTVYSTFYLYWRLHNNTIPVRKELPDYIIKHYIGTLQKLDEYIFKMNLKVCVGAYLLKLLCPPLLSDVFIENPDPNCINIRKV